MLINSKSLAVRAMVVACSSLLLASAVPAASSYGTAGGSTSLSGTSSTSSTSSTPTTTGTTTTGTTSTTTPSTSTSSTTPTTSTTTTPTTTTPSTSTSSTSSTTPATTSSSTNSIAKIAKAGDTVYLKITPPVVTTTTTGTTTTSTTSTVPLPTTRIFTLDKTGVLELPYLGRFSLAGLSEEDAILRLKAEPLLETYTIEFKILPVDKAGIEALKPFGYSLFDSPPTTFAPTQDIPVPSDYVIGTNDTVIIQLFGAVNETYTLVVTREGVIDIPKVGPITVAGLSFSELKENIAQRAAKQMIGVSTHVTLGPLRSILVFVLGDVVRPGSYTVSSLSTLTNALLTSGGVTTVGSLRDIQLKRRGKIISRLDFYDLLLKGDTSRDVRLQGGDVLFVPSIGRTVSVSGEVRRPAIYEISKEKNIKELLALAGGLTPSAFSKGAQLLRVNAAQDRVQEDVDLSANRAMQTVLNDGDVLVVPALLDKVEDIVKLSGYVKRPGSRAWFQGMRLSNLVPSMLSMLPKPDLDYAVIKRHIPGERQAKVFSVRLGDALADPGSTANIPLVRGDELIVFGHEVEGDRQNKLAAINAELDRQGTNTLPAKLVSVNGSVYEPGTYPLEEGMRVSDLIRASGNLKEKAETLTAELSRYENVQGKGRQITHVNVDMAKVLKGDAGANLVLLPRDYLVIKTVSDWLDQQTVTLSGEVRNPGIYPIARGETLSSVVKRAGGLTEVAFADGTIFTRVELQQKEEAHFKELADRIEGEMKATLLERSDQIGRPQENSDIAKSIMDLLRNAKSTGRMVLDMKTILADNDGGKRSDYDVTMLGGDTITIPQKKDEVSVVGEVRKPTTHLYAKGKKLDDYIGLSGGLSDKTKRDLVYVIRANGAASAAGSSGFFSSSFDADIRPGDTIVAMLDAEKVSGLKIWRDIVGSMTGLSGLTGLSSIYDRGKGKAPASSSITINQ